MIRVERGDRQTIHSLGAVRRSVGKWNSTTVGRRWWSGAVVIVCVANRPAARPRAVVSAGLRTSRFRWTVARRGVLIGWWRSRLRFAVAGVRLLQSAPRRVAHRYCAGWGDPGSSRRRGTKPLAGLVVRWLLLRAARPVRVVSGAWAGLSVSCRDLGFPAADVRGIQ